MRDDHDGEPLALAHLDQQPQQARLRFGVQPRQRFIENQRARRARQQPGQHHAAHLTAAELIDGARGKIGLEPHTGQGPHHPISVSGRKSCCRSNFIVDAAAQQL
ncbi:Uncharacterised protein [Mycobacteroides abscessus subsp. abscessus]|nr:Uncharacterised protein [Mycobacteroides abscessus subsp. abscessus]